MASNGERQDLPQPGRPRRLGAFPTRLVAAVGVIAVAALLGASIVGAHLGSASSLGTLTVTNPLMVWQNDPAITPVARTQDLFNGLNNNTNLDGFTASFDPGTGTFGTPAPDWRSVEGGTQDANTWTGVAGGGNTRVEKDKGNAGCCSMALLPWLTRKSTSTVDIVKIDGNGANRTNGGAVLNADSNGTSGIAAAVDCNSNTCVVELRQMTSDTTYTVCGTSTTLSTSKPTTVSVTNFTNTPGAAGNDVTATFTRTGGSGGTNPATVTCDPSSPQTGDYSGLIAFLRSGNTEYDDITLAYS